MDPLTIHLDYRTSRLEDEASARRLAEIATRPAAHEGSRRAPRRTVGAALAATVALLLASAMVASTVAAPTEPAGGATVGRGGIYHR
jgi:hypothetical protein